MEFKLNKREIDLLKKWGYPEEDIKQIEESVLAGEFFTNKGKKVDWLTAKRIVGSIEFLSGISRSAFHWTCMRNNQKKPNRFIFFDFSKYFK